MNEERLAELVDELQNIKGGLRTLRKMAPAYKIKGVNVLKKDALVVELATAMALEEQAQQQQPEAGPQPAPQTDPELEPGYFDNDDLHKPVTAELLDPDSAAGKVYLRWDPETRLIRALKDGELVRHDLFVACENIPPGNQYDKLAAFLAQRCRDEGYEVHDDWRWDLAVQRLEE